MLISGYTIAQQCKLAVCSGTLKSQDGYMPYFGSCKAWCVVYRCESMGKEVVYVSGRARAAGEMNGKSGNMNNALNQIYPKEYAIPGNELVCVFDADQVAKRDFFLKTLPYFDAGKPLC